MWKDIIANSKDDRYKYTLKEILQQPACWQKTAKIVLENKELEEFFNNAISDETRPIIVSGAGSSEFAGKSILDTLSKFTNRRVLNAPTTDIVTHPEKFSIPNEPALMISFARSGNSPESVGAVDLIKQCCPMTKHLIITCNKDGMLAKIKDNNTFCLLLPEETNDESLVMTSSFSSMILAAVLCGTIAKKEYAYHAVEAAMACSESIFSKQVDQLQTLMENPKIDRIQFLGSSDAYGLLTEAHLKMLEMTDGAVATRVDTFLGLRHGPQVFVTPNTVVVAVLSKDSYIRQYEMDLLKELKNKNQGFAYVIIGKNPTELELPNMITCSTGDQSNFFKLFPAIVMCQLLGFFKSMALGLSPDAPSKSGTINRVVQGVTIYPYQNK